MKPLFMLCILLCTVVLPVHGQTVHNQAKVFTSSNTQTTVVELFTSEGCSSCPPADRWLSGLKNDARLWKQIIPLAFHVDYWNYLGWHDPLSDPAHSLRQRNYARNGYARSVYTPGFFTNGREWSAWFRRPQLAELESKPAGVLTVNLDQQALTAGYHAPQQLAQQLVLHVAVLGFDIRTDITRGENRGKTLTHDFVVLAWHTERDQNSDQLWQIDRKSLDLSQKHAQAIAVWISAEGDPTPLQATGGWLDPAMN